MQMIQNLDSLPEYWWVLGRNQKCLKEHLKNLTGKEQVIFRFGTYCTKDINPVRVTVAQSRGLDHRVEQLWESFRKSRQRIRNALRSYY